MAKTTASASGEKRKPGRPGSRNMGRKTMQMHRVETRAGTAISAAPCRIASYSGWPSSRKRSMFSIVTVASSTRMPTASARPPRVMMLIVWPSALRTAIELRIESGIETAMISVLRQLPRKSRIISAVRHAAITASRTTPEIAARTKIDWSASGVIFICDRHQAGDARQHLAHVVDHVEGRGAARLENADKYAAVPVLPDGIGLRGETAADRGHVMHIDDGAAHLLDRDVAQRLRRGGRGVDPHVVLVRADLHRPGGQHQILRADRAKHIRGRHAL